MPGAATRTRERTSWWCPRPPLIHQPITGASIDLRRRSRARPKRASLATPNARCSDVRATVEMLVFATAMSDASARSASLNAELEGFQARRTAHSLPSTLAVVSFACAPPRVQKATGTTRSLRHCSFELSDASSNDEISRALSRPRAVHLPPVGWVAFLAGSRSWPRARGGGPVGGGCGGRRGSSARARRPPPT